MSVFARLSSHARLLWRSFRRRQDNAFFLFVFACFYFSWNGDYTVLFYKDSPAIIWCSLFLALLIAVPKRRRKTAVAVTLLLAVCLMAINDKKIEAIRFPLTTTDLQISARNPVGLTDSLGVGRWQLAVALAFALVGAGTWAFTRLRRRGRAPAKNGTLYDRLAQATFTLLAVGCFAFHFDQYAKHLFAQRKEFEKKLPLWDNGGYSILSRKLGLLGFLAFSSEAERGEPGLYFGDEETVPFSADERGKGLDHAAVKLRPSATALPHLVVVLAESTFDPNAAFRLSQPVPLSLFEARGSERVSYPLFVNAIGGGTWISEFESLTGIDTRYFGFLGNYSHVSLAPYVKQSFVKYLKQLGYRTAAYYGTSGDFYGARKAYAYYGFDRFLDQSDLGLPADWTTFSDEQMVELLLSQGHLAAPSVSPTFSYVLLLENHTPHPCGRFQEEGQLIAKFAGLSGLEKNCTLNEYIRRLQSTQRAIDKLELALARRTALDGRPYVLAVFGDHQPWTFVGEDYDTVRGPQDKHTTFFSVRAPGAATTWTISRPPHVSMLPTLLSSYVATTHDQLYLPENYVLYAECGSNAEPSRCASFARMKSVYRHYLGL